MTLKHLHIFIVVFQQMNITQAAKLLHMTQPAVTRSIQELEKYYGIQLFERINHRLYRTPSSLELYSKAMTILELYDNLEKEMTQPEKMGLIRIGATLTLGNFVIPPLVAELQQLAPKLKIKVSILNSQTIQKAILNNELDIAIVEETIHSDYLSTQLLCEDHLCLILPFHHPLLSQDKIYLEDLMAYPFLLREEGSAGRSFLNHVFESKGLHLDPIWESASTQALIHGVKENIGISILPKKLVENALSLKIVTTKKIEDESFQRKNYIIWHKQKYLTQTLQQFISLCYKHIYD